ncbi:hypothetical protein Tco_0843509 [Tanacetum coccineum]|uniref:Uncharacterized protein n=1 Tax=Tanacetum coccineum TaxID=301880 RepID=A0ABQ5B4H4_9ASTR
MRVELDSWNSRFGSYISMRKLKGWKRTLTSKLFKARCSLCARWWRMRWIPYGSFEEDTRIYKISEDGDKDDQFMGNGQLCCFKAVKMSTGKMNLGMGKPNLVKISKALKGRSSSGYFHLCTFVVVIFLESRSIHAFVCSTIQAFTADSLLFDIS